MDTRYSGKTASRFIILRPHRDAVRTLDEYRKKLFGMGFYGAYSFPSSAILAEVSRPFNRDELKELASNIRRLTLKNDGKIQTSGPIVLLSPICSSIDVSFYGLPLIFPPLEDAFRSAFPQTAEKKIINIAFPPAFCVALANSTSNTKDNPNPEQAPTLSFRAASLSNLAIRPLNVPENLFSFEWRIGTPIWLPSPAKI